MTKCFIRESMGRKNPSRNCFHARTRFDLSLPPPLASAADHWQPNSMTATGPAGEGFSHILADMSRRNVESTLSTCDQFRRWHRANFILKIPAPELVREHADDIRLLLMTLRWLQATLADPGSSARDLLPRIEIMIHLLEDCWQSVHEQLPAAE